ncbi:DUF3010 family protein [Vibrio hepatarius]|jgi:hypothetical protein|uniref:DUF3010 domain-containing protein n=1 Tax=Vibrio hepatarius TaxID=171383 RepID=A0A0M0I4Y0_9VIBR|nr:DUF3010 family protein [Vibrio hepatarius]KOO09386.1 hypothetical protein AKJ31_03265 [Vibrio hepatarius]
MSKICGIELKGHEAIFTVLENKGDDSFAVKAVDKKKISLKDSENRECIKEFKKEINEFFDTNDVSKIYIKKRNKKGDFAGGADTFKMEAIIQDSDVEDVILISSQAISSYQKKNDADMPSELNKYQHNAYLTAVTGAKK